VLKRALTDGAYVETAYPISTKIVEAPVDLFEDCVLRFDPDWD